MRTGFCCRQVIKRLDLVSRSVIMTAVAVALSNLQPNLSSEVLGSVSSIIDPSAFLID